MNSDNLLKFNPFDIENNINDVIKNYHDNGIIYLKDFIHHKILRELTDEINQIEKDAEEDLIKNWQNESVYFYSKNPLNPAGEKKEYVTEPYFLHSSDKAHVFYEAIDDVRAVNRIGHGIHLIEKYETMHNMVYTNNILNKLLIATGHKKPICQLSVYIPKYPNGIGSDVRPHQESTFAYTEPQTVVVLWIALEDAQIENACMWGILGSNKWPLKYISRVNHAAKTREFEQVNDVVIPDFVTEKNRFTPLEVKAGDALLFHGNFVHCSPVNLSTKSRKALSLQFIDTIDTHYANTNWLQPASQKYLY